MAKGHVAILDEAGLKLEDIVGGFWFYLSDMEDYKAMNDVYRESLPARACSIRNMPDARIGHRQGPGSGPRLIHRGADALIQMLKCSHPSTGRIC